MNKMTYVLTAVSVLFISMIAVSWAQMASPTAATPTQQQPGTTTVQTAPVTASPVVAPTAPKPPVAAVQAPVAPQVVQPKAPVATVPAVTTPQAATTAPVKEEPISTGVGKVPPEPKKGAPEDLKGAMNSGEFLKKLSFPLTEAQMVEFARASVKIAKINSKWDVQIAAAEADKMAIEYNNLAVEEIEHTMKSIPGLTLEQYNELTRMTVTDKEFSSIYSAYKQLVAEGAFGAPPKGGSTAVNTPNKANTMSANQENYGTSVAPITASTKSGTAIKAAGNQGVALPPATPSTKPISTPANSGTAPAPQGSPAPQYSPPATR